MTEKAIAVRVCRRSFYVDETARLAQHGLDLYESVGLGVEPPPHQPRGNGQPREGTMCYSIQVRGSDSIVIHYKDYKVTYTGWPSIVLWGKRE